MPDQREAIVMRYFLGSRESEMVTGVGTSSHDYQMVAPCGQRRGFESCWKPCPKGAYVGQEADRLDELKNNVQQILRSLKPMKNPHRRSPLTR